jgi:hypothetical protein
MTGEGAQVQVIPIPDQSDKNLDRHGAPHLAMTSKNLRMDAE